MKRMKDMKSGTTYFSNFYCHFVYRDWKQIMTE